MTTKELLELWRQDVCLGDDVECIVSDAVQLMISHLNERSYLQNPKLTPISEISYGKGDKQISNSSDVIYQVERAMIKAGLEKIYQIEKGKVD